MKLIPASFVLLFASACSGPEVPSAFQPDSPASPTARPAPRPPVATVLAAENPLEAAVCAPGQTCALSEAKDGASMDGGGHQHGGHNHGNHGGHNQQSPAGHEGHNGHNH